jgi:hypothetical protein
MEDITFLQALTAEEKRLYPYDQFSGTIALRVAFEQGVRWMQMMSATYGAFKAGEIMVPYKREVDVERTEVESEGSVGGLVCNGPFGNEEDCPVHGAEIRRERGRWKNNYRVIPG